MKCIRSNPLGRRAVRLHHALTTVMKRPSPAIARVVGEGQPATVGHHVIGHQPRFVTVQAVVHIALHLRRAARIVPKAHFVQLAGERPILICIDDDAPKMENGFVSWRWPLGRAAGRSAYLHSHAIGAQHAAAVDQRHMHPIVKRVIDTHLIVISVIIPNPDLVFAAQAAYGDTPPARPLAEDMIAFSRIVQSAKPGARWLHPEAHRLRLLPTIAHHLARLMQFYVIIVSVEQ